MDARVDITWNSSDPVAQGNGISIQNRQGGPTVVRRNCFGAEAEMMAKATVRHGARISIECIGLDQNCGRFDLVDLHIPPSSSNQDTTPPLTAILPALHTCRIPSGGTAGASYVASV